MSTGKKSSGPAGLRVVVNPEGERMLVAAARLRAASIAALKQAKVRDALVSITMLSSRQMAAMNKKHLGHAGATDVITFGFRDPRGAVLGDIYLCPSVAVANAAAFGVSAREETCSESDHDGPGTRRRQRDDPHEDEDDAKHHCDRTGPAIAAAGLMGFIDCLDAGPGLRCLKPTPRISYAP